MTTTTTMAIKVEDLHNTGKPEIYVAQIAGRSSGVSKKLRLRPFDQYCSGIEREAERALCQKNIDIKAWYKSGHSFDPGYARRCAAMDGRYQTECKAMLVKDLAIQNRDPAICKLIPVDQLRAQQLCEIHFRPVREPTEQQMADGIPQIMRRNVLLVPKDNGTYDEQAVEQGLEVGGWSWDVKIIDVDNDGFQDMLIVNGTWVPNEVTPSKIFYHNTGKGKFDEKTVQFGFEDYLITPAAVAVDIDNDGDIDFITAPVNGPAIVFINNSQSRQRRRVRVHRPHRQPLRHRQQGRDRDRRAQADARIAARRRLHVVRRADRAFRPRRRRQDRQRDGHLDRWRQDRAEGSRRPARATGSSARRSRVMRSRDSFQGVADVAPRSACVAAARCAPAFAQDAKTMQDAEAAYRANDFADRGLDPADAGRRPAARRRSTASASCIAEGRGTARDPARAAEWIGKAAAQGETAAQYLFGRFLLEGIGVERNPAEAAKSLLKAAAKGNAQAQFLVARLYIGGVGVAQDMNAALTWLEAAAEQNVAEAQFDLGLLHARGQGVAKDNDKALKWLTRAAENKHAAAAVLACRKLRARARACRRTRRRRCTGIAPPRKPARRSRSASSARCYLQGQGVAARSRGRGGLDAQGRGSGRCAGAEQSRLHVCERHRRAAGRWPGGAVVSPRRGSRPVARAGGARAVLRDRARRRARRARSRQMVPQGRERGRCSPRRRGSARCWCATAPRSATAPRPRCGFTRRPLGGDATAVAWLESAAAEGVPAAVGRLANLYAGGKGVTADGAKARAVFMTAAADKGDAFAQMQLGLRYAKGEGVTQDYVQAHKWVNLAAAKRRCRGREVARRVRQADDGGAGRRGASARARMDAEKPCAAEVS